MLGRSFDLVGGRLLNSAQRVRVPMGNLPGAVFAPKEYRSPQGVCGDILACAKLGPRPLRLNNGGKLWAHKPLHDLEAHLALPATRCDICHPLSDLLPSVGYPATGVGEGRVLSMGV